MGDLSFLDKHSQRVIERFNQYPKTAFVFLEEDEGSWNLTEMVYGCLLVVSVFSSSHPVNVLLKPLLKEGDLDLWHCFFFFGGYLIIPVARGSIQVGSDMKSTLITAFYQTLVKRGQEEQLPDSSLSPDIIWNTELKDPFAKMFVGMAKQYPAFSHTSFAIEMVRKNRRTYNGKIHSELAISYPYNEPFLLGVLTSNGWIPSYRTSHTEFKIPVSFQL